jgi:hypothetical protein
VLDTPAKLAGLVYEPGVPEPAPSRYRVEKLDDEPLKAKDTTVPIDPVALDLKEYFKTRSVKVAGIELKSIVAEPPDPTTTAVPI